MAYRVATARASQAYTASPVYPASSSARCFQLFYHIELSRTDTLHWFSLELVLNPLTGTPYTHQLLNTTGRYGSSEWRIFNFEAPSNDTAFHVELTAELGVGTGIAIVRDRGLYRVFVYRMGLHEYLSVIYVK